LRCMTMTSMTPELKSKAQWVADLMKADKVTAEMVTPELALAYSDEVGRRIAKMQTIYLTRKGAKGAMQARVLSLL
jgi:hypothetical protein